LDSGHAWQMAHHHGARTGIGEEDQKDQVHRTGLEPLGNEELLWQANQGSWRPTCVPAYMAALRTLCRLAHVSIPALWQYSFAMASRRTFGSERARSRRCCSGSLTMARRCSWRARPVRLELEQRQPRAFNPPMPTPVAPSSDARVVVVPRSRQTISATSAHRSNGSSGSR
jgi:hypothetical protein